MANSAQRAVINAWVAAVKTALSTSAVYTKVPENTAGTFVVITVSAQRDDTKTSQYLEHEITIDIYGDPDYQGVAQVVDKAKLIYDAIHGQAITVSGYWADKPQLVRELEFETSEGPRAELAYRMQSGVT